MTNETNTTVELPALVGTLATLPEHVQKVIEAYGKACAAVAVKSDRDSRAQAAQAEPTGWQPIETAPRDGKPILAWCDHEADPWVDDPKSGRLTLYAAHSEGMGHAPTGHHIVEWGGAFDDRSYEEPNAGWLPDWWFVAGSYFEIAANPTHWMPLPPSPAHKEIPSDQ